MKKLTPKDIFFVVLQFSIISLLVLVEPLFSDYIIGAFIQGLSICIGFWATFHLNKSRLSIFPSPKTGVQLIQTGPYKFIRHPMYFCLLVFFLPQIFNGDGIYAIIYLSLIVTLELKSSYEEQRLKEEIQSYSTYIQSTKKIIPLIY